MYRTCVFTDHVMVRGLLIAVRPILEMSTPSVNYGTVLPYHIPNCNFIRSRYKNHQDIYTHADRCYRLGQTWYTDRRAIRKPDTTNTPVDKKRL